MHDLILLPMDVAPLVRHCEAASREGVFPGASFALGTARSVWLGQAGRLGRDAEWPEVLEDTIYDVASLTKVVATTTVAMMLHDEGRLRLDDPVRKHLPEFVGEGKQGVTLRNLLAHDSGLPAYSRYELACSSSEEVRAAILREPLVASPGTRTEYSCLNSVILHLCLEAAGGQSLRTLAWERIFAPLGMRDTMFRPSPLLVDRIAPTVRAEAWRAKFCPAGPAEGEWLRGHAHDPIAFMLGGVSGNAGLFSTARDLARFARMILGLGEFEGRRLVRRDTVEEWTRRQSADSTRALGWDTRSEGGSSAGMAFSIRSFGHTGYTGTSLWIDPTNGWFAVLLTNRVHADAGQGAIRAFRPRFHDAAAEALSKVA